MKNEKQITHKVVDAKYPHFDAVKPDVVGLVRDVFSEIGKEVKKGEKVLIKNFGTVQLKKRTPRRRYDQGKKEVVKTDPAMKVDFVQSPNIFKK